jgi:hypothetical protein
MFRVFSRLYLRGMEVSFVVSGFFAVLPWIWAKKQALSGPGSSHGGRPGDVGYVSRVSM